MVRGIMQACGGGGVARRVCCIVARFMPPQKTQRARNARATVAVVSATVASSEHANREMEKKQRSIANDASWKKPKETDRPSCVVQQAVQHRVAPTTNR